jgi:pimeloyl-ACP methyl ester carboxylesterase
VEVSQTTRLLTFAAVSIRLQRRLTDRIVRILQFADKIRKTGRKRDAIHTHHSRQWGSSCSCLKGPLVVLEKLIIEGAGHWVQQERPDEVNAALIDFLRG